MNRLISIWLCFVLVASSAFVLVGGENEVIEGKVVVQNGVTYITHAPIVINSNADFGIGINGVSAGDGTELNPWIIEGWEIEGISGDAILIQNTNDYFVIQDCYLFDATGNFPMMLIHLFNTTNGAIDGCIFEHLTPVSNNYVAYIERSDNITATNTACHYFYKFNTG